ncbi:hypothetical protein AB4Y63_08450 [Leifsonia sp. YAF41]|uniref:hypothetical protein n=1 Tax=Leifsonia sp. YAF41 TaxID=3233086 RepID=UPI003F96A546
MEAPVATRLPITSAVRFSASVIGALALTVAVATILVVVGTGASFTTAVFVLVQRPLVTATALACGFLTLFLLTASAAPTTRWGYAWRGAVAASVSVVVAPLAVLIAEEWIPGRPGMTGGFAIVVGTAAGYILIGGPVWAGLITVLLRRTLVAPGQAAAPPLSTRASAIERRRLGLVLCIAGLLTALGITFFSFVAAVYQGADYKCLVDGPHSPLAEISERPGIVTGNFTAWPMGRECTWLRADGVGTVTVDSGNWVATGLAASGMLVALTGAGFIVSARRATAS